MENEQIIDGVTYLVTYTKKEDNQKKQSKRGDRFWGFSGYDGTVFSRGMLFENISIDPETIKPFNHPTEAEAIKARDKILALYRIKTYAEEQRGEFVPDWNNREEEKLYIGYNHRSKEYEINSNYSTVYLQSFYLEKIEHCKEIIEKFKDDLDILFDRKGNQ